MVGELAAGHAPQVQLDRRRRAEMTRRSGHRVAAPRAVAQDEFDVLPGAVLQRLVGRQLQAQHRHVGGRALDGHHAARHLEHRVLASTGHHARFDHAIGLRCRAARQDEAGFLFGHRQRLLLVCTVDHAALEQPALARAAGAVLAAVRQADAGADGRGQDRFVARDLEGALGRTHGDLQAHGVVGWRRGRASNAGCTCASTLG